jgi:sirohydrochlorin ferrochelatase
MRLEDPMREAGLVLVAHGTRNPHGVALIAELAEAVAQSTGPARVAFVDVLGPSPAEALRSVAGPAVVVPAFLASGYHVRTDVPREVADSGHRAVAVSRALGPDPLLAHALRERLVEAGSSDTRALRDVQRAAVMLAGLVGTRVEIGYVATAQPKVDEVVARVRAQRGGRVFIASYLLAPGLFHTRLHLAGADGVAEPIGVHAALVRLVADRYWEVAQARRGGAAHGLGEVPATPAGAAHTLCG